MSAIPIRLEPKSLTKRIFCLRQAMNRAQDPEMKKLWESKKYELMVKYMKNS